MRVLTWLLRIVVFLAVFGLALNNRHGVAMNGFFGAQWQAPLILMCLVFFAAGCALGALAVLWRQWRKPSQGQDGPTVAAVGSTPTSKPTPVPTYPKTATVPSQFGAEAAVGGHTTHHQER
jgi:lipopolysaccharide assembly protein A